jgi:carboxyl-terminal processing protease
VEHDSAAARANLRRGFRLTKIDDTNLGDVLQRIEAMNKTRQAVSARMPRVALGLLNGAVGTHVHVTFVDETNNEREATLKREPPTGDVAPPFGNFPSVHTEFEAKRLANNIAYIRFNIFVMPQMERIRRAIREMADAPGMIFDLRGNPGGIGVMSSGIAGLLTKEQISLGTMQMRSGHINFIAYPQERAYNGMIVVLVDSMSASTSEIFAAGLQELKRAVIIGERTMGAALPSVFEKLPTGALFQYAIADFKTPKGKLIEGGGVTPDRQVLLTREMLLANRDLQLEAAVEHITLQTASKHTDAVNQFSQTN